jgi:hypothetical protein
MHIETMSHGNNKSFKILANKKKVDNFFLEEITSYFVFFSMFCKTWLWEMVKHATHFGRRFMNTMYNKNNVVCKFFFCSKYSPLGNKKKRVSKSNKGIFEN